MKRKLLFSSLFIFIFLISCAPSKVNINNIEDIDFNIEDIKLSHSYQLKDPHVEIISNHSDLELNEDFKILVSLGIMESSGLNIKDITKDNNNIKIHVNSLYSEDNLQLAVPQALINVDKSLFDMPLENYSFEIINDNGNLLDIKLDMNDAISKVESHFKLKANISPDIQLVKQDESLVWIINYSAIFDQSTPDLPLVKFSAKINAMDGSILDSDKTLISNPIDNGLIVNIETDNFILYKKFLEASKDKNAKEELWIYDINSKESELIFTSDHTINSTQFSPDLSYISLIENCDNSSNLYLIPKKTKKSLKVTLSEGFSPDFNLWKSSNQLVLLERKDNKTKICQYNVENDEKSDCIQINTQIHNLSYKNGNYIFTEKIGKTLNKRIYFTKDFKSLDYLTNGFNPEFIDENNFIYLQDNEDSDTNYLNIYSLNKRKNLYSMEGYIENFQVLSKEDISFTEKKDNYNYYILSKLSLKDILNETPGKVETEFISCSISNRVFYNKNHDLFYLNIDLPFEHRYKHLTYLVDSIEDIH